MPARRHLPSANGNRASVTPAEEAFIVTVGVSHKWRDSDCARVLRKLERAGFQCGPTSDEAILQLAEQIKDNEET